MSTEFVPPRLHARTRLGVAGLLALSLTLGMGVAAVQASPRPQPSPSATLEASDTPAPEPATTVPLITGPGAHMGQGLAKESLEAVADSPAPMMARAAPLAAPAASAIPVGVLGMDVSGWQADPATHSISQVNWTRHWTQGARFAYVKASEGDYFADASRSSHLKGATAAGLLTGGYHFALPSQSSAVAQANFFVKNGGAWTPNGSTLPPLLDIENNPYPTLGNNCYSMTPGAMVTWIKAFSSRVLALTGRLPMIYTNYYWWQECTGDSKDFAGQALHIAAYGAPSPWIPGGWDDYNFWQFSDSGPFDGDSNVWNGTEASLRKFAAKADSNPPVVIPQPSKPSIPSPADIVTVDSAGALWNYPATGNGSVGKPYKIGSGWGGTRSINVIDWNADGTLDIVAQWTSGKVNVYTGKPGGGFNTPTTLAASGWAGHQLTIGYWLNASKYPQVLTRSSTGDVNLWGNSSGTTLGSSRKLAQGWNGINLTMVDFDGDYKPDILGQYPDGTLRLFRSDGYGNFIPESRKIIGSGWNTFTSITVYSDFVSPGSLGLIRRTAAGALNYVPVPGTSSFGASSTFGTGWASLLIAGGENINQAPKPVAPSAPPTPTAIAGDRTVTASVTAAGSGAPATSVKLTASPGGASCTLNKAAGSCDIGNLSNGMAYSVTATATNAAGSSPASAASKTVTPVSPVSRLAGNDRYETSAAISRATFPGTAATVYVADGTTFPDALSGAAAAGTLNGPVLLATTNGLPGATRTELARLNPKKIIVLGGTGAISASVQNELRKYSPTVTRLAGADRFATSAAISRATFPGTAATVYIANGTDFPDALSGAAAAGTLNGPVLLANTTALPAATRAELARLNPKRIIVLGGTGAISDSVSNGLKTYIK